MEEDKEPLMMDGEKPSGAEDEEEAKSLIEIDLEAKEGCCNRNLAFIISLLVTITFMVAWEVVKLYTIYSNDTFDEVYYVVYFVIVILLFLLLCFLFAMSC